MSAALLPPGQIQFFDNNGASLPGGLVTFYVPGSLTLKNTYQNSGATILNTNPVVLDAAGRATIFGTGSYDMTVQDGNGNLLWSGSTSESLSAAAVGSFMLPVIASTSATQFLQLSGTASYVAAAIAAIQLMPGPAGPAGAASTVPGPAGPTGAAGSYPVPVYSNGNPGYWIDQSSKFIQQWGSSTTGGGGSVSVNFGTAFNGPNIPSIQLTLRDNPLNSTIRVQAASFTGFNVFTEDTSQNPRAASFFWYATGF